MFGKLKKFFVPAAVSAVSTVAGEIVVDSVAAGSLMLPDTADKAKAMAGATVIGTTAGVVASMFYPRRRKLAAAVGGAGFPIAVAAYKKIKP